MSAIDMSFQEESVLSMPVKKWTESQAENITKVAYGINVKAITLSSERDQNFLVTTDDGEKFVLKITHPSEPREITLFQTDVQIHMMNHPLNPPVPGLHKTTTGDYIYWYNQGTSSCQAIRLISFLDGIALYKTERTSQQRQAIGRALGTLDEVLKSYDGFIPEQDFLWDTQNAQQLTGLLPYIKDAERRKLAEHYMDRFKTFAVPRLEKLKKQIIHNDLNAYNALVEKNNLDIVSGIIDFGDIVNGPAVVDLAVACAYQLSDTGNPLSTAKDVIHGYQQAFPLTEEEIELLPDLIAARLLVTVLITGWRAERNPENREYILRNNPLSWNGLENMRNYSHQELVDTINTFEGNKNVR